MKTYEMIMRPVAFIGFWGVVLWVSYAIAAGCKDEPFTVACVATFALRVFYDIGKERGASHE